VVSGVVLLVVVLCWLFVDLTCSKHSQCHIKQGPASGVFDSQCRVEFKSTHESSFVGLCCRLLWSMVWECHCHCQCSVAWSLHELLSNRLCSWLLCLSTDHFGTRDWYPETHVVQEMDVARCHYHCSGLCLGYEGEFGIYWTVYSPRTTISSRLSCILLLYLSWMAHFVVLKMLQ